MDESLTRIPQMKHKSVGGRCAIQQHLFADILRLIAELRPPPGRTDLSRPLNRHFGRSTIVFVEMIIEARDANDRVIDE
jgi:hypothetical protein